MEWLKDWVFWIFEFVSNMCFKVGDGIINGLFSYFPLSSQFESMGEQHWAGIRPVVDHYVPFTEGVAIYGALMVFQMALIVIRWTLKLIPGLGG